MIFVYSVEESFVKIRPSFTKMVKMMVGTIFFSIFVIDTWIDNACYKPLSYIVVKTFVPHVPLLF